MFGQVPELDVMGRSHAVSDLVNYYHRIEAVNYTMAHDDGLSRRDLAEAEGITTARAADILAESRFKGGTG